MKGRAALAMAAAMAAGIFGPSAVSVNDVRASSVTPGAAASPNDRAPGPMQRSLPAEAMRRVFGGMRDVRPAPWPSREGWSNRRYQRAAAKRRAQAANRRNHRG